MLAMAEWCVQRAGHHHCGQQRDQQLDLNGDAEDRPGNLATWNSNPSWPQANVMIMKPASSNSNLAAGQSTTFGFRAPAMA
jgi:hypothetical protein